MKEIRCTLCGTDLFTPYHVGEYTAEDLPLCPFCVPKGKEPIWWKVVKDPTHWKISILPVRGKGFSLVKALEEAKELKEREESGIYEIESLFIAEA